MFESQWTRRSRVGRKRRTSKSSLPEQGGANKKDLFRAPKIGAAVMAVIFFLALIKSAFSTYQIPQVGVVHTFKNRFDETDAKDSGDRESNDGSSRDTKSTGKSNNKIIRQHQTQSNDTAEVLSVNSVEVHLSDDLRNLANITSTRQPTDRAFFWHVPRSGGSTVKHIVAHCFGLTTARQATAGDQIQKIDTPLKVITDLQGGKYVNVNVGTPEGILRAKQLSLDKTPGIDLVVSPYLYQASAQLHSPKLMARLFTMFRHPVDRAVSLFYFLQSQPKSDIVDVSMSLEEYANSRLAENNWMTRFLTNKLQGPLTMQDEAVAREVLKTKCLVGLLEYKGESMHRFTRYFGWTVDGAKMEECHGKLLDWNWPAKNKHPDLEESSDVYKILTKQNTFDIRLYKYAQELFHQQANMFKEPV